MLQLQIAHHQPAVVIFYSFGYLDHWRGIVGGDFLAAAAGAFYHTRVGNTLCIVIKHPAATGVTSAYFETVGHFIRAQRVQSSPPAHRQ